MQVLTAQVMEEVLPWLQSQLQSRVKDKKTERIRLWLTVSLTYRCCLSCMLRVLKAAQFRGRKVMNMMMLQEKFTHSNLEVSIHADSFIYPTVFIQVLGFKYFSDAN